MPRTEDVVSPHLPYLHEDGCPQQQIFEGKIVEQGLVQQVETLHRPLPYNSSS